MSDKAFICPCEDVTLHEIEHAIELGLDRVEEIKRYTGLGTGPCQGRECMASLGRLLCRRGVPIDRLQPFTSRPPTEPVSFAALAQMPTDIVEQLAIDAVESNRRDSEDS